MSNPKPPPVVGEPIVFSVSEGLSIIIMKDKKEKTNDVIGRRPALFNPKLPPVVG